MCVCVCLFGQAQVWVRKSVTAKKKKLKLLLLLLLLLMMMPPVNMAARRTKPLPESAGG